MRFKFLYKISDVYFCLCSFFIVIIVFGGWKNVLVQFIPYRSIFSTVWSFCFKRTPFFEFLCFFVLFKASFGCSLMYKYKMLIFFLSSTCTGPVGRQRRTSWLPGTISPTPAATSGPRPPPTTSRQQYQKRWTATTSSPYRLITARTPAITIVREEWGETKNKPKFFKNHRNITFRAKGLPFFF